MAKKSVSSSSAVSICSLFPVKGSNMLLLLSSLLVEFPAVLLDTSTGLIDCEFHSYVQPQEHPVLSEFCTELTGITQVRPRVLTRPRSVRVSGRAGLGPGGSRARDRRSSLCIHLFRGRWKPGFPSRCVSLASAAGCGLCNSRRRWCSRGNGCRP